MAVLSTSDYQDIKKLIKNSSAAYSEFKSWGLDRQTWMDAFQGAEDWIVNGFTSSPSNSFKSAIEIETGAATNAQIKQLSYVWMCWRVKANP